MMVRKWVKEREGERGNEMVREKQREGERDSERVRVRVRERDM